MNDTINNTYFIKALENYPYDLEESIESLKYALSYDEHNADVHCLMAQFYMDQLYDYETAQYHLEEALAYNIDHIKSYQVFIRLCIQLDELNKAEKLIDFASTIKGFSQVFVLEQKAYIKEKKGNLKDAKAFAHQAISNCICNTNLGELKKILSRLDYKIKLTKTKSTKKRKKGKKEKKNKK